MSEPAKLLRQLQEVEDMKPVWLTRRQLMDILERSLVRDGMTIAAARIHARMNVEMYARQQEYEAADGATCRR